MHMHILSDHQFNTLTKSMEALQAALAGAQSVQLDLTAPAKEKSQAKTPKSKPKAKAKGARGRGKPALTAEKVLQIRQRLADGGTSASQIARDFDVHLTTINCIKWNKTWKHVQLDDAGIAEAAETANTSAEAVIG